MADVNTLRSLGNPGRRSCGTQAPSLPPGPPSSAGPWGGQLTCFSHLHLLAQEHKPHHLTVSGTQTTLRAWMAVGPGTTSRSKWGSRGAQSP